MLEKEKSIIIIFTTISICIMILTGIDKGEEKKIIENTKSQAQANIDILKGQSNENIKGKDLEESKVNNTSENIEESIVTSKTEKSIEAEDNNESDNESVIEQAPEENLKKDEDTEKTSTVFKVNREDIFSDLTLLDKEKLFLISTKLKASDYKKISELLAVDLDGQGTLTSLKILKERLSKNDYSKIKEIFGKFINMDLVNN